MKHIKRKSFTHFKTFITLQGGRVPPNPYHAYNSTYNPVSRYDDMIIDYLRIVCESKLRIDTQARQRAAVGEFSQRHDGR